MSRDKQIEEIVKDFCPLYQEYGSCTRCNQSLDIDDEPCYYGCVANIIIDYGYRKASEVVEEIFAEIKKKVKASFTIHLEEINKEHIKDSLSYDWCSGVIFALRQIEGFLAELKKKYTESEKDNGKV